MPLTRDFMLERMYASDREYEGRFLTGVLTTGIYCLSSCPARKPKPENVKFFLTEVEAREAGLRACRRCRPDDYYRHHDPDLERLTALTQRIRQEPGAFADVGALVESAGLGLTKLSALFRLHYHLSPADFLNRARIADACRLLTSDSEPTALETAFAVGYESLSAFHDNFRKRTGLTPTEYRRLGSEAEFTLALPAGYLSRHFLQLQGHDPQSVTERVTQHRLTRALLLNGGPALLSLEFCDERVRCRIETRNAAVSPEVVRSAHAIAARLLGLANDPTAFERRIEAQENLARLIANRRGLRVCLTTDPFEAVTWAIVGQQISLPFAYSLRRRLAELCGARIGEAFHAHPTPAQVARLDVADLLPLQFSRRKAEYLIGVARQVVGGELPLDTLPETSAVVVEQQLLALRGFGPWSANYVMMRGCGFADSVPVGDSGLRTSLRRFFALDTAPDAAQTAQLMEVFAPCRSLATQHLWMHLGDPE